MTTDTTKAPERLYFYDDWLAKHTKGKLLCGNNEYIRKDVSDALIAAAVEASADLIIQNAHDYYTSPGEAQRSVRTFASAVHEWLLEDIISMDARAALAARDKQVREEALREAAECIGHITQSEDRDAILSLITQEDI